MTLATMTPITPDLLRGCLDTETTADGLVPHRPPAWVRARGTDLQLADIVAQRSPDDPSLQSLDGRRLYGPADSDALPLPDRLHPDAATHRVIGERFAALAFAPGGPFHTPGGG